MIERKERHDLDNVVYEKLRLDYKRLSFVEWLELLCRLCSCVFVVDSKTASKTKNQAIQRLIEDSKQPFANQLISFLSVFLKQLCIQHTKNMTMASSHGLKAHQQAFYQEVFENIHD